jgi:hypothetical protein
MKGSNFDFFLSTLFVITFISIITIAIIDNLTEIVIGKHLYAGFLIAISFFYLLKNYLEFKKNK